MSQSDQIGFLIFLVVPWCVLGIGLVLGLRGRRK